MNPETAEGHCPSAGRQFTKKSAVYPQFTRIHLLGIDAGTSLRESPNARRSNRSRRSVYLTLLTGKAVFSTRTPNLIGLSATAATLGSESPAAQQWKKQCYASAIPPPRMQETLARKTDEDLSGLRHALSESAQHLPY